MRARVPIALLVTAACRGTGPLPDTPVVGGSERQRELARLELADFDRAVGAGRLEIPEVRFEPRDAAGSTRLHTHAVRLDVDLDDDDVRWVLRHELCHALDFEEDLTTPRIPLLDRFADDLFAEGGFVEPERVENDPRLRRSEALAAACSLGHLVAQAASTPCDDDPPVFADLADWLNERVWTGDLPPVATWSAVPTATFPTSIVPDHIDVDPTADGGLLLRVRRTADGSTKLLPPTLVDLDTGAPSPSGAYELADATEEEPPGLESKMDVDATGWTDGPAAAWGRSDLWHLGWSAPHLYVYDSPEAGWRAASPGCALPAQALFPADGRVWAAWAEGESVVWAPVTP